MLLGRGGRRRFEKVVINKLKWEFDKDGPMKKKRLKNAGTHVHVLSSDSSMPLDMMGKQHDCVLCCRNCTDSDGLVRPRTDFHIRVKRGHTPNPGLGRRGHKTSSLCATCGFIPLCRKPRSCGANALSCWELFHTCEDLFSGLASTMC